MAKKLSVRIISVALALVMVFSAVPAQAIISDSDFSLINVIESVFGLRKENELFDTVTKVNSVFVRYFGTGEVSENEIEIAVSKMDKHTVKEAISDVKSAFSLIKRNDKSESLLNTNSVKLLEFFKSALKSKRAGTFVASATSKVLDGKVSVVDSQGTGTASGNNVTVTVKGTLVSAKTNIIDIYNNTNAYSTLRFNYEASNYNSFSLDTASGTYAVLLAPGASISLSLKAAANKTATLKLSDFSLIPAAESSDVKIEFNSAFGSVTVDGSAVAPDEIKNISFSGGATLVATPKSGSKFIGWIDTSNSYILSKEASYKINPALEMTVRAVFAGTSGTPYFLASGGNFLFEDLNKAINYASSTSNKTIILMNNATLPAGNYHIPSGIMLLIPFDDANTVYTTQPEAVETRTLPTAYRTLTLSEGANITVDGSICLPAKHYCVLGGKVGGASPDGPCSFIKMESGSNITLNNGANLYAYGFITGSGTVTAKNGANVYEYFQIMDFRGGTQSTDMDNGVFPLSQYYIQNIEVPLTLEAGAVETCFATVGISGMTFGSGVAFIARSGAMFNLSSGSLTKSYDTKTDRLVVEVNGTMTISPIELKFGSGLMSMSINSKNYELPINNNITVKVNSGNITLAQDVAMLPGSQLIISDGAKCVVGSGCNVYVYDSAEWGGFCSPANKNFVPLQYAPGRKYNRTNADLKDAVIQVEGILDASAGYIYTTAGGADIFGGGSGKVMLKKGSQTKTYQLVQNKGYTEIPITFAKLKNADGTYKTMSATSATLYSVNGVWLEHTGHIYSEEIVTEVTCDTAGLKRYTCFCGSSYTEAVPAKGHTPGAEATCTSAQLCLICSKELSPALGHSYNSVKTLPTCTEGGYTTHTCANCSDVYVDEKVPAKGHTPGAEATCTSAQLCSVCGEVLKDASGHNYKSVTTKPTCTEDGFTTHTCTRCNDTYTDSPVAAKGHTPGAEATCTSAQKCTACGATLKSEKGHVPGNAATCTEPQVCLVCDEVLAAALGHNYIYDDGKDATCTEDGYSSGSHCSRCDFSGGYTVIPAKGHKPVSPATCTEDSICKACGEILEKASGHNYKVTVTYPTCTEKGFTTHSCLNCSDTYTDNIVPAKGHTKGAKATCESSQLCTDCGAELSPKLGHVPGSAANCTKSQLCLDCGEILVPAKGHTPGAEATCTAPQTCTVCKEELFPATGHSYSSTVTEPTCTAEGYTTHKCSKCGDTYTDNYVAACGHDLSPATCTKPARCTNGSCTYTEGTALGHNIVIDEEMPVYCLQNGLTQGKHCSRCHAVFEQQMVIPAIGHNIVKYDAKKPTYTEVGWEAYEKCTRCTYTTYVEIPRLEEPSIEDYETFIQNLALLEELAQAYASQTYGKDPLELVIKYIRTGVDKYNEGSWGIMAGYEDAEFAKYVAKIEDEHNVVAEDGEYIIVSGLKNISEFAIPNGNIVDFGHMFGSMDITYHNKKSKNHADVSGWAGDLVDLIEFSDYGGVSGSLDEMIADISANYLLQDDPEEIGGFNQQDMYGDLDSLYLMQTLLKTEYEKGSLTELFESYFTKELSDIDRADYFLKNRLDGVSTRGNIRDAVYNNYTGNKLISTLEATKEFKTQDISGLRRAVCYAFADYICELAGDFVEVTDNPYFTVFNTETTNLAPGVIQNIKHATSADNKQMVYYTATADLTRDDVFVYANYKDNDPTKWGMQTVLAQATAAQNRYGDPESNDYIENYNVIASINADGFNMSTGEPGGLLIMNGEEYHGISKNGFFGITKDGKAVIGTTDEYNKYYKDQLKEAVGGFGTALIKDGKVAITATSNYYTDRASRTAVGITRTGKVVFMVLDGRQEPVSCGGSMIEIAHIMYEAGCVEAINLDGGGSTTYVAKPAGEDSIRVVSRPSDGAARSVSTSLLMVSTAPSSTAFDHAIIESETDFLTKNTSVQLTAAGVSATGNAAELPEGTSWAVSDKNWATVTQDGLFTGLRNGSVDVYLMLGDEILGTKTMNIVVPDRIHFSKTNIDAVYGERTTLPIVALYENKEVAIQTSDIVFSINNTSAGTFDGFAFIGTEGCGIKSAVISAALAADSEKTASVNVSLYNPGEVSFDFDSAVGGDRTLAWNRVVSNSTTEDKVVYTVVNPDEPMVTKYTFAIDMTQIPIPEQLADLTSMLPGAELEGASAWTFLLQLAERVSVLTEVRPKIYFDKNFDVDYSKLVLVNECFALEDTIFNEEENSVTLILKWIDQTQAIDPAMANPLCIVNGIELTPKADAQWTKDSLNVVNKGDISYEVYLRANALYSFALKSENQEIYGIYPFVNPDNVNEKGGYFGNVYASLNDSYTLSTAVKTGWVNEDGGFAYYKDGERLTGINEVDGYYYDFGESGINVGQVKYTGLLYDEADSVYRYAKFGELTSGWQMIGEDWYLFDANTLAAVTGTYNHTEEITYEFDETGKIIKGCWVKTLYGNRYYYGPSYYEKGWYTIEGKDYRFYHFVCYSGGYHLVNESNSVKRWYRFEDDGSCNRDEIIPDGFYTNDEGTSYSKNGEALIGIHLIDGTYYCFDYKGYAQTGDLYGYYFGEDFKAYTGIRNKDGVLVYYFNGKPQMAGLVEIDGDLYFAGGDGKLIVNQDYYVWQGNGILPESTYEFGADGSMLNGLIDKDGDTYYYYNGKATAKGLVEIDGAYYFASSNGLIIKSQSYYVWQGNGILPEGTYEFGADGRMLNGFVEKDGEIYYYRNGIAKDFGLIELDGAYYFASANGLIIRNRVYNVWQGNGILPEGDYEFGADGKMLDGIIEKDGELYYYVNGKAKQAGLIEIDGEYYFASGNGKLVRNQDYYVWQGNGLLPEKTYTFDADGKMLNGFFEKDGVRYYYVDGKPAPVGLNYVDGYYYFVKYDGSLVCDQTYYIWQPNGYTIKMNYTFNELGQAVL